MPYEMKEMALSYCAALAHPQLCHLSSISTMIVTTTVPTSFEDLTKLLSKVLSIVTGLRKKN